MNARWSAVGLALVAAVSARSHPLRLVQSIPLPHVSGRIDHLAIDPTGARLFVAALGNNTVEVVDLEAGKVARTLTGFSEPQGVVLVPEFNRLYVANGGDGSVRVLDATNYRPVATIALDDDADNVRYDAAARQVYVGYGSGALGIISAQDNTVVDRISLSAHPESFQLESLGSRLFVNLPGAHTIAVVDRSTRQVVGHWSLGLAAANFPMALDEANHRAFVGCRTPARLLVFDTRSGKPVAKLELHGDCDDVFHDGVRHQIYASCGEGFIDVFAEDGGDHYTWRAAVQTAAGARTSLCVGDRLYLAVPHRGQREACIQVYAVDGAPGSPAAASGAP